MNMLTLTRGGRTSPAATDRTPLPAALCSCIALLCAALLALPTLARAADSATFGISSFGTASTSTQAGAHADFTTSFALNTDAVGNPVEQLKDSRVELPAGLVGDPRNIPQCSDQNFEYFNCPEDSEVGVLEASFVVCAGVETTLGSGGVGLIAPTELTAPVLPSENEITVASTTGIVSGDYMTIDPQGTPETIVISRVDDATHLTVTFAIQNAHTAGMAVAEDTLPVASTKGLCASSEENSITIGTGASAETVNIAYLDGGTRLILERPLLHQHNVGEPIVHHAVAHPAPIGLFNLQPSPGHAATLGSTFLIGKIIVQINVREDGSYGLVATISDLSTMLTFSSAKLILWGVPADPSHDSFRCGQLGFTCGGSDVAPAPFMSNPTNCSTPLTTSITVDSWQNPGRSVTQTSTQPPLVGCERLQMAPTATVTPATTQVDSPSGYDVDLKVPQDQDPYGLATPDLKKVTVTLPAGTSLSPAVSNGLEGCSDAQFAAGSCPDASKVGSAAISSPLLPDQLQGSVYVGAPTPAEMYRVFLTASADSVTIRLTGHIHADPSTGQLTIVFDDNPQQPVSDLRLSFFSGPTAALANPATCGPATTSFQLESYAGQVAEPSSSFVVDADGRGGACPSSLPFSPSFSAGTISPLAGSFSPLSLTVARADGQASIGAITAQLPPGLLGMLSRVPQCGEAQAAQGSCPEASRIGTTTVGAGAGSAPFYLSGAVYLTGPYKGAPFGLSIVVPAIAGPYDLGTIVLRAQVLVNASDLQLTIVSDALPQILSGIPLRLRSVHMSIDRTGFIFNPTSCARQTLTGSLSSAAGTSVAVSAPFQANGCAGLSFAPKLTAATQARATSTGNGAGLEVSFTNAQAGSANVRSIGVELPTQLRPRLNTIQQACVAQTFFANPAACPATALVGTASVQTPVLAAPATGPLYLVFRGGTAYPDLFMDLQSQGVRVQLDGTLTISHKGVIDAVFAGLPDVPIEAFHLTFPEGPHSLLGATADLCSSAVTMPTTMLAQNGRQVSQSTKLKVSGCKAGKSLTQAQKLAKALKACKKQPRAKRAACQTRAVTRYGKKPASKASRSRAARRSRARRSQARKSSGARQTRARA